jgi:hypothetical protein
MLCMDERRERGKLPVTSCWKYLKKRSPKPAAGWFDSVDIVVFMRDFFGSMRFCVV